VIRHYINAQSWQITIARKTEKIQQQSRGEKKKQHHNTTLLFRRGKNSEEVVLEGLEVGRPAAASTAELAAIGPPTVVEGPAR
jgi:hypothetical protein